MSDEKKREYLLNIGMTASLGSFTWGKKKQLVVGVGVYLSVLIIVFGGIILGVIFMGNFTL